MRLPFGEWMPDHPDHEGEHLVECTNVLPTVRGYSSFAGFVEQSSAMPARCIGAISVLDSGGNAATYAGDSSSLYRLSSNDWADATNVSASAYTTASDAYWEFAQWRDTVLATNWSDVPQEISIGASAFISLAGSPPRARHIAVVRDFVVLGDLLSGGAAVSNKVRWSAIGNPTSWTTSATTQCDAQGLEGPGGRVMRIIGGEWGTIFRETAIVRMTYVGSPLVFMFDEVEGARGTPAPGSVVRVGGLIYYLGNDDFYVFDGSVSHPLGSTKLALTVLADIDPTYYHRVVAAADPVRQVVYWAYRSANGSGDRADKVLVYHWPTQRWSVIEITGIEWLGQALTAGYTLDQLDAFGALDALSESLDSRFWAGGGATLGVIANGKLGGFNGPSLAATLRTGERQLTEMQRTLVKRLRLRADEQTGFTLTLLTRDRTDAAVSVSAALPLTTWGDWQPRSNARYHAFQLDSVAGSPFQHLVGLEVTEASPVGVW